MEKSLVFYVQRAVEEKATENSYISIFFDIFYKNASPKEGWLYHVYFKKPFAMCCFVCQLCGSQKRHVKQLVFLKDCQVILNFVGFKT